MVLEVLINVRDELFTLYSISESSALLSFCLLLRMKRFICLLVHFLTLVLIALALPSPRAVLMNSGRGGADIFMMRCVLCSRTREADGLIAPSAPCAGEPGRRAVFLF